MTELGGLGGWLRVVGKRLHVVVQHFHGVRTAVAGEFQSRDSVTCSMFGSYTSASDLLASAGGRLTGFSGFVGGRAAGCKSCYIIYTSARSARVNAVITIYTRTHERVTKFLSETRRFREGQGERDLARKKWNSRAWRSLI